jgi:hypothetical protein
VLQKEVRVCRCFRQCIQTKAPVAVLALPFQAFSELLTAVLGPSKVGPFVAMSGQVPGQFLVAKDSVLQAHSQTSTLHNVGKHRQHHHWLPAGFRSRGKVEQGNQADSSSELKMFQLASPSAWRPASPELPLADRRRADRCLRSTNR